MIEAPTTFGHAGQLRAKDSDHDPRRPDFPFDKVVIDLRDCRFIRPAAVLWCLIYPLLVRQRGIECEVLGPLNKGVATYLMSVGLFSTLRVRGVVVDDRGLQQRMDSQIILPLTEFSSTSEAEQTASNVSDGLQSTHLVAANLVPDIGEAFAELANNAAEHSESEVSSYGLVQFYDFGAGRTVVCAVADGGIGIRASLAKNPEYEFRLPYDWIAIEYATEERISSSGSPTRGIGLYGVSEEMQRGGRQLGIHSGIGAHVVSGDSHAPARRPNLFPGTVAFASVPC